MNILITGATRGIGKAIAEELSYGNKIYAVGRNQDLLKSYEHYHVCDLSSEKDLKILGDYIADSQINILINNAGEYIYSEIDGIKYEQIKRILTINLEAPLYLTSRAVPYMKEQKFGRIINIGSISGVMGEACASIYSASKAGLIGGTKALALELAEYNITANVINPGWVDTQMGNSSSNEGGWSKDEILECIPQKRFVTPEEVAGLVKYLISDEAKGITGQSINICAGLSVGF